MRKHDLRRAATSGKMVDLHLRLVKKAHMPPEPVARGEAHRKKVRRTDLGEWKPKRRKRDPLHLLDAAMAGRVRSLLPLKRERMAVSPFAFFRGAAPLMAYDLSLGPHTAIVNQLCGDAHVQNLGAYAGIDGRLIFDINDFDETIRGPFEWDVKRMATSILLAGEQAKVKAGACAAAGRAFLDAYCDLLQQLSRMPVLEVARFQVHRLGMVSPIAGILGEAERATPLHSLEHLTVQGKGGRRFRSDPPVLRRGEGEERRAVLSSLPRYRESLLPERQHFFAQFRPVDVAFKVVGTGSVGTRDYCILFEGNGPEDPLFLQIKEETASAYAPYLPKRASPKKQNGERVADGQRAMQLQSDPLLGWTSFGGRDYLVRQLNDHKASLDVTTVNETGLTAYARVCGEILARGHARSGDARLIAGYVGNGKRFKRAMENFAEAYAAQTKKDWQTLRDSM